MKKVKVSIWMETGQAERLADLSKRSRVLIGDHIGEAIEDLLKKHDKREARETKSELKRPGAIAGIGG